jgi:hypothetical protein
MFEVPGSSMVQQCSRGLQLVEQAQHVRLCGDNT